MDGHGNKHTHRKKRGEGGGGAATLLYSPKLRLEVRFDAEAKEVRVRRQDLGGAGKTHV